MMKQNYNNIQKKKLCLKVITLKFKNACHKKAQTCLYRGWSQVTVYTQNAHELVSSLLCNTSSLSYTAAYCCVVPRNYRLQLKISVPKSEVERSSMVEL